MAKQKSKAPLEGFNVDSFIKELHEARATQQDIASRSRSRSGVDVEDVLSQIKESRAERVSELLQEAEKDVEKGEVDKALFKIDAALEIDSDSEEAWLAKTSLIQEHFEGAPQVLLLTMETGVKAHSSSNEVLLLNTGTTQLALENYKEAEEAFKAIFKVNKKSAAAFLGLALVSSRTGEYEKAERRFQRAARLDPTYDKIHQLEAQSNPEFSQWLESEKQRVLEEWEYIPPEEQGARVEWDEEQQAPQVEWIYIPAEKEAVTELSFTPKMAEWKEALQKIRQAAPEIESEDKKRAEKEFSFDGINAYFITEPDKQIVRLYREGEPLSMEEKCSNKLFRDLKSAMRKAGVKGDGRTYFTYGSLMNDMVRADMSSTELAVLPNFKRVFNAGANSYYANIRRSDSNAVTGVVYRGVTESERKTLNHYEGDGYRSFEQPVMFLDGEIAVATVYMAKMDNTSKKEGLKIDERVRKGFNTNIGRWDAKGLIGVKGYMLRRYAANSFSASGKPIHKAFDQDGYNREMPVKKYLSIYQNRLVMANLNIDTGRTDSLEMAETQLTEAIKAAQNLVKQDPKNTDYIAKLDLVEKQLAETKKKLSEF